MMIVRYCKSGNLRDYLNQSENCIMYCQPKINHLYRIARGLLVIHEAGKVHRDLHSGNILFDTLDHSCISDLGLCQPTNNKEQSTKKGAYGVLPYMAPEVLCGYQYTKAADVY